MAGTESKSIAATAAAAEPKSSRSEKEPFGYCLNLSTIRGQKLSLVEEIEIAAKAGYQAIEPWMNKIDGYVKEGGSLGDLGKRIADLGLTVESAIGFAEWIVDDDTRRARGMEQAKRDMATLREIGGKRIAAPPAGATDRADLDLFRAAERYGALVDLGEKMDVIPQVEVWGFSKCLSRLGETMFVAIESGRTKACILPDVYHIFKGGSDFAGLGLLSGNAVHVFHVNDYPAEPKRETMQDAHRVYPGDGIAPLTQIFRTIRDNGFRGYLSLELFNPDYWRQDALQVARTGLQKTREAVSRAFA
ncbi:MAG: sugar phosphate isomerase/epimerase [Pirellulales bacterium]